MARARERIRELTARSRLLVPLEEIVADVNRFLRGWTAYFRHGNSAHHFDQIRYYVVERLAGFIAKRHRRRRGFGRYVVYGSSDTLGLIALYGIVAAPRPTAWRAKPNADGERRR